MRYGPSSIKPLQFQRFFYISQFTAHYTARSATWGLAKRTAVKKYSILDHVLILVTEDVKVIHSVTRSLSSYARLHRLILWARAATDEFYWQDRGSSSHPILSVKCNFFSKRDEEVYGANLKSSLVQDVTSHIAVGCNRFQLVHFVRFLLCSKVTFQWSKSDVSVATTNHTKNSKNMSGEEARHKDCLCYLATEVSPSRMQQSLK